MALVTSLEVNVKVVIEGAIYNCILQQMMTTPTPPQPYIMYLQG